MTLIIDIEATEFGADAVDVFQGLAAFEASDEMGKVVLSAAASLLAGAAISQGRDIFDLINEFGDLVESFEYALRTKMAQPPAA